MVNFHRVHPHSLFPQRKSQHIQHPQILSSCYFLVNSPQRAQSLSYFLVVPGFDLYMNGIIQYFPFHIWLLSLFTTFVRFIHVVTCYNILLDTKNGIYLSIVLLMGIWVASSWGYYKPCCYEHSSKCPLVNICTYIYWICTQKWNIVYA